MSQVNSILHISTRDQRGGAEATARQLFHSYQARRRKSWLVVGKKYSNEPNIWEIINAPYTSNSWARAWLRLSESFSPLRWRGLKGCGRIQAYLHLVAQPAAWYRRQQGFEDFAYPGTKELFTLLPEMPDLIHCHNLHGDYFDLNMLPWLSRQRPLLLHLQDTWLLTGHCAHFLDCTRWQNGCGSCPYLETYPAVSYDNTAANWQHKQTIYANSRVYIVAASQWLLDQVQQSMLQGVKACVIPNAIDLTQFNPGEQQAARRALGLSPTAKIVLFSGHSTFKDIATTQEALRRIHGENLLFIGLGATKKQGLIAGQCGQGHLITPGYVKSPAEMANYYRAADLYCHTAIADTFPLAILEAMACGTPVVATAVGGIPEQVQNGKTGLLVPRQDVQATAVAIQTLLDDRALCTQMGKASADYAKAYFGLSKQVDTFLNWYEEIQEDWRNNQSSKL